MSPLFLKPTSPNRGWFVAPFGGNPWWVYLAAAIPALLVTILIFMDQQITAVIVNRKEHKLKVMFATTAIIAFSFLCKYYLKIPITSKAR